MKLDGASLLVFAAIADHGSLSGAARHLGIQKSSVSRTLALMEARYGHRLIERTTRQLRLTEAGIILLDYAHRVGEEIETADAAMAQLSAEPAGLLKVTAPQIVAQHLIVPMLRDFLVRYPKIRIGIDVSSRLLEIVSEGVDVAVRIGPLTPSGLIARRLGFFQVILAASPTYVAEYGAPLEVGDLAQHRLIDISLNHTPIDWDFGQSHSPLRVTPSLMINEAGLARDMAVAGLGVVRLPRAIVIDDLAAGRLIPILPDVILEAPPLYAVYPSRRALAPKVVVFLDALASAIDRKVRAG
jgi:DNA-binding transcriptional LysR family regulator